MSASSPCCAVSRIRPWLPKTSSTPTSAPIAWASSSRPLRARTSIGRMPRNDGHKKRGPRDGEAPFRFTLLLARLAVADLDFDLARFRLLALGKREREHAVVVVGPDVVRFDRRRQGERPLERAVRPLIAVDTLRLFLCFLLLGAVNGQEITFERDLDLLGLDPGNLRHDPDRIGLFKHVDGRNPRSGGAVAVLPVQTAQCFVQDSLNPVSQVGEPRT